MDNDTGALHQKKEQLYQRLQELSKHISGAINELKERRDKRNELTKSAQEEKQKRKDLSKIIKDKITDVKTMRAKRGDKPVVQVSHSRDSRGDDRLSPGKLKEEIARIERTIETSAMDYSAEQKLTKVLKEKKSQLAKLGGEADLDRNIRTLSKEIDKLKKESDVAHDAVTKAAKESQEHHEVILKLSKAIEDWKTEEVKIKEEYQSTKAELQQAAPQDLPMKKTSKSKGTPATISAQDVAVLKEKAAEVEQKVKDGKKLTTEDLLAFQAHK